MQKQACGFQYGNTRISIYIYDVLMKKNTYDNNMLLVSAPLWI